MSIEFYWVGLALTLIVSVARITRLVTFDDFPPTKWLREKYVIKTIDTGWEDLATCIYCASWWISLGVTGLLGYFAGVFTLTVPTNPSLPFVLWWLFFGSFAVAYAAAIFVGRDGDDSEPDEIIVVRPDDVTSFDVDTDIITTDGSA